MWITSLQDTDAERAVFQNIIVLFHVSVCSTTFLWQVIGCTTWHLSIVFAMYFATKCLRKFAHMEKLERMILHCIMVSDST